MWARRMCERVRDPRWVHAQFSRDVADDVISRDVNIFFIKLHLLDPTAVLPAFNSLSKGTLEWTSHMTCCCDSIGPIKLVNLAVQLFNTPSWLQ